jgi:hypothetical protein
VIAAEVDGFDARILELRDEGGIVLLAGVDRLVDR